MLLAASLAGCLIWVAATLLREPRPDTVRPATAAEEGATRKGFGVEQGIRPRLEGEATRAYLEQTGEGRSLMRAVVAELYSLKWQ
jgi:hypothetical protein